MGDSDSDYASDHSDIKSYCRCIYAHKAINADELELNVGDIIRVIDNADHDWWWGEANEREGWFSTAFIQMVNIDEPLDYYGEMIKAKQGISKRIYSDSYRRKKIKILDEFLLNEIDYVTSLGHVVEGYYKKCKSSAIFSEDQVDIIFTNITELYEFHKIFLRRLKRAAAAYSVDQIAQLFLANMKSFSSYIEYCTNFSESTELLNSLLQLKEYRDFFNTCRCNDQQQIRLPLSSYLLGPVQRICKYPLQLEALLKVAENQFTEMKVKSAHKKLKVLLEEINDQKKKSETYMEIDVWQQKINNWTGPNLNNSSSELVHFSEVILYEDHKRETIMMYLFDNQLLLCSKTSNSGLVYRNRLRLSQLEFKCVQDVFHITYQNRTVSGLRDGKQFFEIYVKNRRQRQRWHYLLQLEIGFAKIKEHFSLSVELHNSGQIRMDESNMANEICHFIRQCNRQLKIHFKNRG